MTSQAAAGDARAFFEAYATASMVGDATRLASFYAPNFIFAGPKGSAAFPNDANFLQWLESVFAFNRQTRMESMDVVEVRESRISDAHATVTVTWGARFAATGAQRIDFDITYLIEDLGAGHRILAYVAHTDQDDEMRRLGLLPNADA